MQPTDNSKNGADKYVQSCVLVQNGVAIGSISLYAGKYATYSKVGQAKLVDGDELMKLIADGRVVLETRKDMGAQNRESNNELD